ncbi:hypothetical protein LX59_01185 [Azomonas agilis]|uniref:Uncharacterized protein n=1 Tax=Azomonas agilis TaxID=116849 RepID=A0A562IZI5_9GAMM|nr:hypothetical protein LX59_01185 [Azomonas agilis]
MWAFFVFGENGYHYEYHFSNGTPVTGFQLSTSKTEHQCQSGAHPEIGFSVRTMLRTYVLRTSRRVL